MELVLFIFLTIIAIVVTILIFEFKHIWEPGTPEDPTRAMDDWSGLALLCAVIATILWISVGVTAVDLD